MSEQLNSKSNVLIDASIFCGLIYQDKNETVRQCHSDGNGKIGKRRMLMKNANRSEINEHYIDFRLPFVHYM